MTPQERQLIDQLFDRLATLETSPRDPEAVRAINNGLDRAPHALYALVQTVLVQDEALKRADARIRALEEGESPGAGQPQTGFLDNMRDALFGRKDGAGSVPPVRGGEPSPWNSAGGERRPMGLPPGMAQGQPAPQTQGGPWTGGAPGAPAPQQGGGGGSFLGTAAATAAGVVGGAMLMNSMKGLFGGEQGKAHSAFDQPGGGSSPWDQPGGNALGRDAGLDDVNRGGDRFAAYNDQRGDRPAQTGADDVAAHDDAAYDDASYDDGELDDDFGGGDSDYA